ncbi:MAG: pyrroloquinoline quinone biosynthesis peptide chaperone PqqD [Proteobacteria bacterium]|nr:pyrroloquinoline quinone biosynthesis peptide chaperone PqqD [Pseudomonadota bacterium]
MERVCTRPEVVTHASVRSDEQTGKTTVVLPERVLNLGGSSGEILARCDGRKSAEEIAEALQAAHPEGRSVADDVHEFLDEMERLGAIRRLPAVE